MRTIPATDLKNQFGTYLGEVVFGKEPLVVEKHGRPVAVLVRYEDWINKEKGRQDSPALSHFLNLVETLKQNHPTVKYPSSVDLIREVRDEEGE